MLRTQNSPLHRSGKLLCSNVSGSAQSVNRSSLGYSPRPQHLEPCNVVERTPASPTFMPPVMAPDGNVHQFHPMDYMAREYYTAPLPMYTSHLPEFSDYNSTADRFVADAYGQRFDDPTDFGGMFFELSTTHQPPVPPAAPEEPIPPNSVFHYHPCRWMGGPRCDGFAPGKNREMGEHLRVCHRFIGHERDTVQCEWENCGQIMQRMNVPRHIVSRHLLAAAKCRFCGKRFSRPDVVGRHERTCSGILRVSSSSSARI